MQKFKNKYQTKSPRLQDWDYGLQGTYFITIDTKKRIPYFGEIKNDEMILNELGMIVNSEWLKTPSIRPNMNLMLGEFIVMPNHFHGIIAIGENVFNAKGDLNVDGGNIGNIIHPDICNDVIDNSCNDHIDHFEQPGRNIMHDESTRLATMANNSDIDHANFPDATSNQHSSIFTNAFTPIFRRTKNKFGPQFNNMGSIIRGFKSSVTTYARKNNIPFNWQARYHDRIIRTHDEFIQLSNYIINNPINWKGD